MALCAGCVFSSGLLAYDAVKDLPTVKVSGVTMGDSGGNNGIRVDWGITRISYMSVVIPPAGGGSLHTPASKKKATAKSEQDPNPCAGKQKSDPITIDAGAKVETVADFALPGEMGLTFVRYYNSRFGCDAGLSCLSSAGAWSTNLDYKLQVLCTGSTTTDEAMRLSPDQLPGGGLPVACAPATFTRPDGSMLSFDSTQNFYGTQGETVPMPGPFNGDGTATLTNNGDGTYTVHDEDARDLAFDSNGNLVSIKDASGIGWTISRPDAGTVVVTHTNGQSFKLERTNVPGTYGEAREIRLTDPAGHVYVYESTVGIGESYIQPTSGMGVIDSVTLPGSPATTIGYQYSPDNPSTTTYAQLQEVDYNGVAHDLTGYDSAGRADMSTLADGNAKTSILYGSNGTGPTATLTNPLGHVNVYQYNASNLLVSVTGNVSADCDAFSASDTYDANGNMLSSTDNNGNVTKYTYDADGLLHQKIEAAGTAEQRTTDYAWDPAAGTDRLLSETIEGYARTAYTYDAHNRLASVAVTNLSGHGNANQTLTTTYAYALYGNGLVHVMTVVPPSGSGNATVDTYDSLGRLVSRANGLGQATTYGNYNGLDEPGKIVGPNGDETDVAYDARGRVVTKTTHPNGGTATWSYAYDGFGLPATRTEPDGAVTTWNRDAEMRVTSITHTDKDGTSTETFGYDANDDVTRHVVKRSSDVGLSESMAYDQLGRLLEKNGTNGQKQTYQYDLDGNVASVTNVLGHTVAYQRDALNRVVKVTESGGATLGVTLDVPSGSTNGSYAVSWSGIAAATSYTLQEQVNGGGWSTVYTGSGTSQAFAGKGDGNYGYRLEACNAGGCGGWSAVASTTVLLPPPEPASLSVPATSSGSVTASWPSVSTATRYILQHADYSVTGWSTIYSGSATSYTQHETVTGAWVYQVQACNSSGCSDYRLNNNYVAVTIPPASAPSLSVPAGSTGSYTVSWGGVSGAASYTLQEQANGGSWSTAYSGSATSKAFSGKSHGASYGYRVQACNAGGCGPWSATHTVVVVPAEPGSLSAPGEVPYPGDWTVSWTAVSGTTSYTLQRTNTATGLVSTVYTGAAASAIDGDALPGTYQYAVKACNAAGCSAWRNGVGTTTAVCNGSSTAARPAGVQPDQIKCGNPLSVGEGATP
jgi:YD repeat-containing protein